MTVRFRVLRGLGRGALALGVALAVASAPAPGAEPQRPMTLAEARARAAALLDLGRRLFNEPALSASGRMSCASCHDPAFGFTPANALPVQLGGADGRQPGTRAVPTLTYLQAAPPFNEHFVGGEEDGPLDGVDEGPAGGLTWDGRVDRGRDQARIPLLSANEMANRTADDVARHALAAGYGPALRAIYGDDVTRRASDVFDGVTEALEAFEQDPATFYPYTSKYDAFLSGRATLSPAEARGLAAFNDENRGNCAECHISKLFPSGGHPDFTDFGAIALGVPRNPAIPANRDPAYFDLGVCGPLRTDLAGHADDCGLFKTPTLRNVALKKVFFHNGVMHSLRDAVAFYARRDLAPERVYPVGADGRVRQYDDLPRQYWVNLHREAPLDRRPGDAPPLTEAEIDDIVAFLGTLTDGYETTKSASR
jgi:cytochrome c peroxidase